MSSKISLKDRHTDATQSLILGTAIEILESSGFENLSVRAVAKQAGMSERTVFRYFATRDEFLDGVAAEAARRLQTPPVPETIEELPRYPEKLFTAFEEHASLMRAVLHTEIFKRVRSNVARERWESIRQMIDSHPGKLSKKQRARIATNINYFLSGSTWNYYRSQFELSLEDSIACARSAIRAMLAEI